MDSRELALALWREGDALQESGDEAGALACYDRSLAAHPTAEAHTYRGAVLCGRGDLEEAIASCHRALALEPGYGNACNDLGAYHALLGRIDEAIAWFTRAKEAPRSDAPQNPCLNLGRLYAKQGRIEEAVREFRRALELCPEDPVAMQWLERLAA